MTKKDKVKNILENLGKIYGEAEVELNYNSPFELFVAVVLSAQCTDKRVNIVTKDLFKTLNKPEDYKNALIEDIELLVKSTGFYKNKAKNLKAASIKILDDYNGKIPDTMEDLIKLPGAGRKTANVILGKIFNKPAITVDTHVKRLSKRIGLTKEENPEKIEYDMQKIIEKNKWFYFSNLLIRHGRAVCNARKPKCCGCTIKEYCKHGRGIEC